MDNSLKSTGKAFQALFILGAVFVILSVFLNWGEKGDGLNLFSRHSDYVGKAVAVIILSIIAAMAITRDNLFIKLIGFVCGLVAIIIFFNIIGDIKEIHLINKKSAKILGLKYHTGAGYNIGRIFSKFYFIGLLGVGAVDIVIRGIVKGETPKEM